MALCFLQKKFVIANGLLGKGSQGSAWVSLIGVLCPVLVGAASLCLYKEEVGESNVQHSLSIFLLWNLRDHIILCSSHPRLHVLSHWRRAFVGVQTAGSLLANCPVKHPPFFQYQILPTKKCFWAFEAFLCPCDETDKDVEVQHQDDVSEILPTFTEARVRARCVAGRWGFCLWD